ncbi:hypothetical protein [Oceanirhabdus sp. W0125-5]|uniref:hypothetical protein n=1 Tax=Oceanirhabdus sp. W0125-5 TaxID=2999116 RepID=UPI0022F2BDCE|nr:hypothetical protein [Oceanirhabdus sp. W0125-5]WBW98447.1 hypothetical protein OW730_06675 [Oceanirhabdus sp. W0125-5]
MKKNSRAIILFMAILLLFSGVYNIKLHKKVLNLNDKVDGLYTHINSLDRELITIDEDKFIFFTVNVNVLDIPKGALEDDCKPDIRFSLENENGEFELEVTRPTSFQNDTKLVCGMSNIGAELIESNQLFTTIQPERSFSSNNGRIDIIPISAKITALNDYSLKIQYDNTISIIDPNEVFKDTIECNVNGETYKFEVIFKNYGLMNKSQVKFKK